MASKLERVSAGFLIAAPTLGDPNFDHTVVLVCAHNDEGAMGLVINRAAPLSARELMQHLGMECSDDFTQQVLIGGPVSIETGMLLYQVAPGTGTSDDELVVTDQLRLCASQDRLREIADGNGPRHFRLFLGHSGWGAGQIENEIAQGAWIPAQLRMDLIFDMPLEERWEGALSAEGLSPAMASTFRRQN